MTTKEQVHDMKSLIEEGFGRKIKTLDDVLDACITPMHSGGVKGIVSLANSWSTFFKELGTMMCVIRMTLETAYPEFDMSKYGVLDMIELDIVYMDSTTGAAMKLHVIPKETGDKRLDAILKMIIPSNLTDHEI